MTQFGASECVNHSSGVKGYFTKRPYDSSVHTYSARRRKLSYTMGIVCYVCARGYVRVRERIPLPEASGLTTTVL